MRPVLGFVLGSFLLMASAALAGPPAILPPGPAQPSNGPVPAIPEPAALALFVLGAGVVGVAIRRRQS
jgi:hypothetical protein